MSEITKKVEALLFVGGEGMSVSQLATLLKKKDEEIESALKELKAHLEYSHSLTLMRHDGIVSLATSASVSKLVEDFAKEEFAGELTRAALETLTVVAYKGPVKRSEIDYIRGVNSSFMIRNLLMRGLIERTRDTKDQRAYFYKASPDFLKFLGISSITDLPAYGEFAKKLAEFIKESEATSDAGK